MYRLKPGKGAKKGQTYLQLTSSNGKTLHITEHFTQKHSAFRNVQATLKTVGGKSVTLQDDSLKAGPIVYTVTPTSVKVSNKKPKK